MGLSRTMVVAFRIALLIAVAVILHLAITERSYPVIENLYDKFSHVLAFCALALLSDFSFPRKGFGPATVLWLLGFGLLIEVLQYFLPHREASVLDWIADGTGIAAYWLCIPALKRLPVVRRRWNA